MTQSGKTLSIPTSQVYQAKHVCIKAPFTNNYTSSNYGFSRKCNLLMIYKSLNTITYDISPEFVVLLFLFYINWKRLLDTVHEFALWSMPTASFVAVMWLCQFDMCFKALFCKGFDVPYSVWREPIMPVSTYSQSFCIFVWCWRSPCSCTSLSCAADLPELLTEIWI